MQSGSGVIQAVLQGAEAAEAAEAGEAAAAVVRDSLDYSDKFNTELTPEQEARYQKWAKDSGRDRDVYDYDMRGAWADMQQSGQGADERGHFTDKYKKPNHPTFSDQSKYSNEQTPGGRWSTDAQGRDVYTPSSYVTKTQGADRLRSYFSKREPDAVLNIEE